jgi:hypothetical protein
MMMQNNFISASANITQLDPMAEGVPIVTERKDNVTLNTLMSNSFGFGGTNASLIFHIKTIYLKRQKARACFLYARSRLLCVY